MADTRSSVHERSHLPRLIRTLVALAALVAALAGCDPRSDPITPRGAGFQQTTDGELMIWFGGPCLDVVEIDLSFVKDDDDHDPLQYIQRAPGYVPSVELPAKPPDRGTGLASVTDLTLNTPVDGMQELAPLPTDLDWRDFRSVRLLVKTTGGQAATYLSTETLTDESEDHPGKFYVQDQGWFDKSEFSAAEGTDFKALCSSINPTEGS